MAKERGHGHLPFVLHGGEPRFVVPEFLFEEEGSQRASDIEPKSYSLEVSLQFIQEVAIKLSQLGDAHGVAADDHAGQ